MKPSKKSVKTTLTLLCKIWSRCTYIESPRARPQRYSTSEDQDNRRCMFIISTLDMYLSRSILVVVLAHHYTPICAASTTHATWTYRSVHGKKTVVVQPISYKSLDCQHNNSWSMPNSMYWWMCSHILRNALACIKIFEPVSTNTMSKTTYSTITTLISSSCKSANELYIDQQTTNNKQHSWIL